MNPNEQDNQQPTQNPNEIPALADNNGYPPQDTPPQPAPAQPVAPAYPEQPTPQPAVDQPYGQPQPPTNMPVEDPGKVYSIIGLVLAFVPLMALFGLILSIIGTVKSSKANFSKTLGIVGIVINGASIVLAILGLVFFVLLAGVGYSGTQERAQETSYKTYAFQVAQSAETTFVETGAYPASVSEVLLDVEVQGIYITDGQPILKNEVGYKKCSETGAQVYYFDSEATLMIRELGDASSVAPC